MGSKAVVNSLKANELLYEAFECAKGDNIPDSPFTSFVERIITGSHLTFRYILFTELLAKATCQDVNALCLQAGSSLDGAYDARSLCHEVIVPFEKEQLKKILGGSNEPFLNKPARFPDLSLSNPIRRGNDLEELTLMCDNLPRIETSSQAKDALIVFLGIALELIEERADKEERYIKDIEANRSEILDFFHLLLRESHEGESLTLVVANIYDMLYRNARTVEIEVHPVNQCGASSKEISDLDIKENGALIIANELKDKDYTETDIEHAVDKVIDAGGNQMYFIVGNQAKFVGHNLTEVIDSYKQRNFLVNVIPINEFLDIIYPLCRDASMDQIIKYSSIILKENKFKKSTEEYFYTTIDLL